ncbi:hypothetical protein [Halobacterium salinarum]|uniref:hypothetical protein n=1 Tax=Halobacterium salinarum TaxID=2242 RepID=UPI002555D710|nr:hypothetical protein [Halobacterium salinarum]MDL0133517.1 hypothetical protein [Halobacterium salinarum]
MPEASPTDVRLEIDTHLDKETIKKVIARKARDIDRATGVPSLDAEDRSDLEALLAAIHIATRLDRAESSSGAGPASVDYEESMIEELRSDARRLGATDELLGIGATDKTATVDVPSLRD